MTYIIGCCLIIALITLGILVIVNRYGNRHIRKLNELPKDCDVVIILGAGVRPDGNPCDLLADRLQTGVKTYLLGYCKKILLTGDNSGEAYNELAVMKNWIIKNYNIPEEKLLIDNMGFCTYDSMNRAKNIFNVKKAIISTNRYHLPRAIYIAKRFGIEAYGVPSDLRQYDRMKKYKRREKLAQVKDFFLCLIKINK